MPFERFPQFEGPPVPLPPAEEKPSEKEKAPEKEKPEVELEFNKNEEEFKTRIEQMIEERIKIIEEKRKLWKETPLKDRIREGWRMGQETELDEMEIPSGFLPGVAVRISRLAFWGGKAGETTHQILREGVKYIEGKTGFYTDPLRQSETLSTKSTVKAELLDGFMTRGDILTFGTTPVPLEIDPKTKTVPIEKRRAEVIVLDNRRDARLREMCKWAKEMRNLPVEQKTFLIAQRVYNQMGGRCPEVTADAKRLAESKKDVLIGEMTAENNMRGVCRHRAFLFHKLAKEAGIDTCLRRGYLLAAGAYEAHAWNEIVDENGKRRVVDIMNPVAEKKDFETIDYEQYQKEGGFPEPFTFRLGHVRYLDPSGKRIYSGTVRKITKEKMNRYKESLLARGYSQEKAEENVQDRITHLEETTRTDEEFMGFMEKMIRSLKK